MRWEEKVQTLEEDLVFYLKQTQKPLINQMVSEYLLKLEQIGELITA